MRKNGVREREIGENCESVFFIYGTVGRLRKENMWMTLFFYFLFVCTLYRAYKL